jgi:monoamine oxidase
MSEKLVPPQLARAVSQILERRQFIKFLGALGAMVGCREGLMGSRLSSSQPLPQFEGRGQKVIVLGAGLSGLCAAYELDQRGFQVTLLEKTNRVSGRVWTNYDYFDDGQYCELGATRIPDCHDLTIGYAKKFGLELAALDYGDQDNTLYYLDGIKRFKKEDPSKVQAPWPEDRSLIESAYGPKAFPLLGNPTQAGWPKIPHDSADIAALDAITFADFLTKIGYSEFARKIVTVSNGSESKMYSALLWLAGEYLEKEWNKTLRVKGGNEQLAHRFVTHLSRSTGIEFLSEVLEVESSKGGVRVIYRQKGQIRTVEGAICVSTLPLDVLKKVKWSPALSPDKSRASKEVVMQPVTRINLQFNERFWENEPYKLKGLKILHSDLMIERLWDMTGSEDQKYRRSQVSPLGILTVYIQSENAVRVGKMEPKERLEYALKEITQVFPEATANFRKGMSFLWHQQDWVGGGWSAYGSGQVKLYKATQTREGQVFFAGDHSSLEPGWMQGAFQSAHRVISEIAESQDSKKTKNV